MSISETLRAYSPAFYDHADLEKTGRILLPESILNAIMTRYDRPPEVMIFSIRNQKAGIACFAGVQEFKTQQGHVCMPFWMMDYLRINEGDPVIINLTTLPTATRALFQPQDSNFLKLPNTKVILEYTLRSHPCLTQGTIINIYFNNKVYKLKVLKTEPQRAVQILRADVVCDFATPVNEFDHKWNQSDTDSSDDEESRRVRIAHTIGGQKYIEKPKPIRSTLAQREKERRTKPDLVGVKRFEAGEEILPPKPKEAKRKVSIENKQDPYQGGPKFLKVTKSNEALAQAAKKEEKKRPAAAPLVPQEEKKPEPKPAFVGKAHNLKGEMIEVPPPKQSQTKDSKPPSTGSARNISQAPPKPTETPKQADDKSSKENAFKGKPNTLK